MNDLLTTKSFEARRAEASALTEFDVELGGGMAMELAAAASARVSGATGGENLVSFFQDIDILKTEMDKIKPLLAKLQQSNEESRAATSATAMRAIRARMDAYITEVLHQAKFIKMKLESLDKANEENRTLPGCEQGSTVDRTRITITHNVRKSLKDLMDSFQALREKMGQQHRDAIGRMYYTITGEKASEGAIDSMIEDDGGDNLLQKAVREQGRGQVIETIKEIKERHDTVKEIERSLIELHQIFMDMAVLVEAQGHQIDDIEAAVKRASSFVKTGNDQLHKAKASQRSTRKWMCIAIIILLIIIVVVLAPVLTKALKN